MHFKTNLIRAQNISRIFTMTAGTASKEQLPFDLTILRSFRVLRPLKLVSKVPSKFWGAPSK